MKIYGPYTRKDGRLVCVLYNNGVRTTISYPKLLIENHLNRKLTQDETVDHIDGNPQNNDLSNLQILSRSDNARKSVKRAELSTVVCKLCGKSFQRRTAILLYNKNIRKRDGPFCSKSCVGKLYH